MTALTSSWEGSGALLATGAYYNWGTGSGTRVQASPVDVAIHLTQVSSTASNVAGLQQPTSAGDPRP